MNRMPLLLQCIIVLMASTTLLSYASGNLLIRNYTKEPLFAVVNATSGVQKSYGQTSQRCYFLNPESRDNNPDYPWFAAGATFSAHYAPIKGSVMFFDKETFEGGLQNPLQQCEVAWRNKTPLYKADISLLPDQDNILLAYPDVLEQ